MSNILSICFAKNIIYADCAAKMFWCRHKMPCNNKCPLLRHPFFTTIWYISISCGFLLLLCWLFVRELDSERWFVDFYTSSEIRLASQRWDFIRFVHVKELQSLFSILLAVRFLFYINKNALKQRTVVEASNLNAQCVEYGCDETAHGIQLTHRLDSKKILEIVIITTEQNIICFCFCCFISAFWEQHCFNTNLKQNNPNFKAKL